MRDIKENKFDVIGGEYIKNILSDCKKDILDVIENTYISHEVGLAENPDSYFLRFKDKPESRIIALPSYINDCEKSLNVAGIKWISSFPQNIEINLQRASAAILLNDRETGYPFCLLEGAQISATRTAASAVLAANHLNNKGKSSERVAIIGGGVIARNIIEFFYADNWNIGSFEIYDSSENNGRLFSEHMSSTIGQNIEISSSLEDSLSADIVIFTTTASSPYLDPTFRFNSNQLVLNISLRDIPPEIIIDSNNVFDDVEHCMKANTSPHLAEQMTGNRNFANGTLAAFIMGKFKLDSSKPTIFSPFGLGVLDLALSMYLYNQRLDLPGRYTLKDFFPDVSRWGELS
ncbi:2,3-diaminopropionate biosynthesis protein SbnB [Vibrio sp. MEBiC08052]|uniref:2,3-diaminopropionate biosynthesis protein SbnB n=1 Tax=Vibrio sp. MEBiC08052 TaxID=1761910 RepID=UPI000740726A|nr:2,3-diaminopropionate biosynthesis protein SbnB [Vibrio sp. MEBiC08052]KUI97643.1 ornithine cyclodeaminase/mu-crystallin [Vibrio sp. MEBiC08052]